MTQESLTLMRGELLAGDKELTLAEVCVACNSSSESIIELTDEGVISPSGRDAGSWRFRIPEVNRIHRALRIQRDLGVNAAGAALALDLLDEIEDLSSRLHASGD